MEGPHMQEILRCCVACGCGAIPLISGLRDALRTQVARSAAGRAVQCATGLGQSFRVGPPWRGGLFL